MGDIPIVDVDAIRFQAQVFKVQTLIDGGLRLTLDIGQIDPAVIVALFDAKQPGVILECAAVAIRAENLTKLDKNENNETQPKDGTPKLDRRRFIQRGD
jgi:hypothetical protein